MKRRKLLKIFPAGLIGLSGCSSLSWSEEQADQRTGTTAPTETTVCTSRSFQTKETIESGDVTIDYEVSKSAEGVDYELFSVVNSSDSRINLEGYRIFIEDAEPYQFEGVSLIPAAELHVVTYGEPGISTATDDCLKYDRVQRHDLQEPVFQDNRTTVRIESSSGENIVRRTFALSTN